MTTVHVHSYRVDQASGMVSVQAKCSIEHARLLMQERAGLTKQTVEEVADQVVKRQIRFDG